MKLIVPRAIGVFLFTLACLCPRAQEEGEPPHPLTPREVVVVANAGFAGSVDLAKHYMQGRGIPEDQLLVTGMTTEELVSRAEYERSIARPIKEFLTQGKLDHVRCIVLMIGVPLKVDAPAQDAQTRQMEILLRSTLEEEVGALFDRATAAQRIALPPVAPTPPALQIESKAKASEQLTALLRAITEELRAAAPRIEALSPGEARDQATQQWLEILHGTLGWANPATLGLRSAPDKSPPLAARKAAEDEAAALMRSEPSPAMLNQLIKLTAQSKGSAGVVQLCDRLLPHVKPDWTWRAAVDSELCTLFWPPFSPASYVPNPLAVDRHARGEDTRRTLMACRLDGPDLETVRKMIDTSLAVEAKGLAGKVYIDARGREGSGGTYGGYDTDLRALGSLVENQTTMPLVLNNEEALFQPGECPDAAFYCGWYSLAKYVDAFDFVPGAVAFHMASAEAVWLRKPGTLWCASLLRDGVVATLGPVEEPYLTAFPLPSEFFGRVMTGAWPLADCYFQTLPRLSWMMTLIGDPLYNPCKLNGPIDPRDLEAALAGETE